MIDDEDVEIAMFNPRDEAISAIVRKYKSHPLVERAICEQKVSYYTPSGQDPIRDYLGEAATYRLLSEEDEARLFPKIERGYRLYTELGGFASDGIISSENEAIFIELTAAQQVVYLANLRLVFNIAKKYLNFNTGGIEAFDHLQEGQEGLTKAINRFDASRGYKFSTMATNWIQQSITRAIADKTRTIRIPAHKHEKYVKARMKINEYGKYLGRDMTIREIETTTGMDYDKYQELMRVGNPAQPSLDAILPHTDDFTLHHLVGYDHVNETISAFSDREELAQILKGVGLSEKESFVLGLRFGVDPELLDNPRIKTGSRVVEYGDIYNDMTKADGLTLEELGEIFGVTRERIRQIEKRALDKLQQSVKSRKEP